MTPNLTILSQDIEYVVQYKSIFTINSFLEAEKKQLSIDTRKKYAKTTIIITLIFSFYQSPRNW